MRTTVTFRGEEREVEFEVIDEPDVNAQGVSDWGFAGLSLQDHKALNITEEEEISILDRLWRGYVEEDAADYE